VATHARVQGIDVEIDHQPRSASITLHDPDGVEIELFTPSEGSILEVEQRVRPTG
jgi:hypothetical protein